MRLADGSPPSSWPCRGERQADPHGDQLAGGHVESGHLHDMIRFCGPMVKVIGTAGWPARGAHFLGARRRTALLPNTRSSAQRPRRARQASDIQIEAERS